MGTRPETESGVRAGPGRSGQRGAGGLTWPKGSGRRARVCNPAHKWRRRSGWPAPPGEGVSGSGVRVPPRAGTADPARPRAHVRPQPPRIRARARPRSERVGFGSSAEAVWEPWEQSEASAARNRGQG